MSERYTKVFSLPENLYSDGSPVVIAAGALLKDNQSGRVLAQLKLRSISTPKIKAVTVRIIMKDVTGNPLGAAIEHQYLDINVARDQDFAQKVPIVLPDNTARGFDASVVQVIFDNNRIWNADGKGWIPLVAPTRLRVALGDSELEKEYKRKFGTSCEYLPTEQNGLWYCSCGALNGKQENSCHKCNRNLATLLAVDLAALKKDKDARLAEEAKAEAAARAEAEANRKKATKIGIAVALVALVAAGISAFIMTKPARVIEDAQEIVSTTGDYMAAVALLDELNKPEKTAEARQGYINDMESEIQALIDEKDYVAALKLIEKYSILETAEKNIKYIQRHCKHDLKDTAKVDATCTVEGYDRKTCTICGCIKEKVIKPHGHKFTSEVTKESTCIEYGEEVFTCSICGEEEIKELSLLPHEYTSTVTQKATYTEKGKMLKTCSVCGATEEEDIPMLNRPSQQQTGASSNTGNPTFIGSTCLEIKWWSDGMPASNVTNFKSTDTVIIAGCLSGISGKHNLVIKWSYPNGTTATNTWYNMKSGDSFNNGRYASDMGIGSGSVSVILESTGATLATYYFTVSE